ncbi:MAG TPA: hypothetical protein PL048_05940 [Leptospiraceae bacterium]|nr:hypothetical protein [Leptospiraceae bacterium]HMY65921.1 hypothetical protein [Leptospiraceae bacterium]HMZ58294.1 hypothetical protein [Leptospiraceae bacterium]HNF15023.1 hypothetical protein [Leptospiraceae bacterium]HNF25938.1 hypothetical protein [Leptospiraceae bacterium]
MGRTISAYSGQMDNVMKRLNNFRRGLRKEDQEAFDFLMRAARLQVQSGVMASNPNPLDSMILSALVSLKRENLQLKKDLDLIKESLGKFQNERPSV